MSPERSRFGGRTTGAGLGARRRRLPVLAVVAAVVVGIVAVSVVGSLTGLLPSLPNPFGDEEVDRTQPAILEALEDVSTYQAATGNFQVTVDLERDARFLPGFLAGESRTFLASGTVDSTVDFSDLDADNVEVSGDRRSVKVTLPAARLTEARIDADESRVTSQDRGLFTAFGDLLSGDAGDDARLYRLAEDRLESAAVESELTDRAEANTRTMLETLLGSLGFTDIEVVFEEETAP
ncbi:MAG: DUF4230 domain-containing protein [Actinomycetota bacterium]|nr:DUF4230 domain-containing protein [Actinomycetota bacterium]